MKKNELIVVYMTLTCVRFDGDVVTEFDKVSATHTVILKKKVTVNIVFLTLYGTTPSVYNGKLFIL